MVSNQYQKLHKAVEEAQQALRKHKKTCATVSFSVSTDAFWQRKLLERTAHLFPEVVSRYSFSDGGSDYLTLIAPPDAVVSSLQLVVDGLGANAPQNLKDGVELLTSLIKVGSNIVCSTGYGSKDYTLIIREVYKGV